MRVLALAMLMVPQLALAQAPLAPPPPAILEEPPAVDGGVVGVAPLAPPPVDASALPGMPDAGPCSGLEAPDELYGKAHLERAIRAELDGRLDDAKSETEAGLQASPNGRYAAATRELAARVELKETTEPSSAAPRVELTIASTIEGIAAGGLLSSGLHASDKGVAALLMTGSAVGIAAPILLTTGRKVRPAVPGMFETGGAYGLTGVLLAEAIGDGRDTEIPATLGMVGGSLAGVLLGETLHLSGGDSGAAFAGMALGAGTGGFISMIADTGDHDTQAIVLAGMTLGMISATVGNQFVHWTRGRWILVMFGGGVGVLFGAGVAILADVKDAQPAGAFMLGGMAAGAAVTAFVTSGFAGEVPAGSGAALLELRPDGKLAAGAPGVMLVPTSRGVALGANLLAGQF